ncbi:hypothetical protein Ddc_15055 [Ditylenchus destructor]|nr:hypothetical protein Ddc_15055 [Ditylenchus destructor]
MENDILIDVFRLLSRKQLSQSIELVCRRFRRLVNSPALPNLHLVKHIIRISPTEHDKIKTWGIVIWFFDDQDQRKDPFFTYEELQTTHRPTQYLRFAHLNIRAEHLAKEQWRKCLWEFRHCFVGCTLMLGIRAQFTAIEFQCFLADWILRLFPNCTYFFDIGRIIRSTGSKKGNLPSLEALANFNKSNCLQFGGGDRQAIASSLKPSLLISLPSILNSPCVQIRPISGQYLDAFWAPSLPQDDVLQWLHHVPTVPATIKLNQNLCKSKRNLFLSSAMLKPREEDRSHNLYGPIADVRCCNLVKQIKQSFLQANTSDEKREFYLELYMITRADTRRLEPFDIQNDATNERLTLKIFGEEYYDRSNTWELLRESV